MTCPNCGETRTPSRNDVLEEAALIADEGHTYWRDKSGVTANKRESRDYETMAIACVHVAAAIRARKDQTDG